MIRKQLVSIALCISLILSLTPAYAFSQEPSGGGIAHLWFEGNGMAGSTFADGRKGTEMISWTLINGEYYLVVPNSADLSSLKVYFDASGIVMAGSNELISGSPTDAFKDGQVATLTCDGYTYNINVRKTSAISSMFISTQSGNLDAVHADQSHKEPGQMLLVDSDGITVSYNDSIEYIKGRGNSSWLQDKKPYNIKLDKKTRLLGMGNSKKWSLLAVLENSHIRDDVSFGIASEVGIEFTPEHRPVDLYINNEYAGLYRLIEKVEIGDPLVDITDLNGATEDVNIGSDLDSFTQKGEINPQPGTYKYFDIPNDPADITGGYLLEWELSTRYAAEASGFVTSRGQSVVIKYPEFASKRQVEYIRGIVQDMEDAVYSLTGVNGKGKHYSEYLDEESFAKMYVFQEFVQNLDAGITSFYIYKESDLVSDGMLRAAPPWDFNNTFGCLIIRDGVNLNSPDIWWANQGRIYKHPQWTPHILNALYRYPDFVNASANIWNTSFVNTIDKLVNPSSSAVTSSIDFIGNYIDRIRSSAQMNALLWNLGDFDVATNTLADFAEKRASFLSGAWSTNKSLIGRPASVVINGSRINTILNADGSLSIPYSDIMRFRNSDGRFTVNVPGLDSVLLELPAAALGNDTLTVTMDFGSITIPNAAIKKAGAAVRLSIKKGSFIVDLLDNNGNKISYNDENNPLSITLPYTLAPGSSPNCVVAVANGKINPFPVYRNGSIPLSSPTTGKFDVLYNAKSFPDVSSHWGKSYIDFVTARNMYVGNEKGEFLPNDSMTRAMFCRVLANLEGVNLSAYKRSRFKDVSVDAWYATAIEWAAENGVVRGVGDNRFDPNSNITREQMAVMIRNYVNYKNISLPQNSTTSFADEKKISAWALSSVKEIQSANLISGRPGNLFDPLACATRAEAATVFTNFIKAL